MFYSENAIEFQMNPIISVCIPTFNQEKYIEKCLISIIDQDIKVPYEIVVADDCSTDETAKIIDKLSRLHPEKIRVLNNSTNLGPTQNTLLARSYARGKYICHCDGDDFFYKNKLRLQYEFLEKNPRYIVAWHQVDFYDNNGSLLKAAKVRRAGDTVLSAEDMLAFGSWGANSSIMYRYDGVPYKTEKKVMYDFEFAMILLSKSDGGFMSDVLGGYRVGAVGSLTNMLMNNKENHLREAQIKIWLDYAKKDKKYKKFVGFFALLTIIKSVLKNEKIARIYFVGLKNFYGSMTKPSLITAIRKRIRVI